MVHGLNKIIDFHLPQSSIENKNLPSVKNENRTSIENENPCTFELIKCMWHGVIGYVMCITYVIYDLF